MPAAPPHALAPPAPRPLRRPLAAAITAAGLAVLAACGTGTASTQPDALTGTHVSVAVVPITDAAPFMLAVQRGYFTRAGLHVTYTITPQSTAAAADLVHGSVDVIAAANSQCGTNTEAVLTSPPSGITKPADLAGKTIAVNVSPNVQTLTITRQLQASGVPTAGVRYVVIPFANMAAALAAHRVDAIGGVEPFLTQAKVSMGAQVVLPQCTGPTAGIPLGGYLTTAAWAAAHPAAARAFARAVEQGQALAATDRGAVENVLPTYMHISKSIAALVNLNTFPTSTDTVQLQRVANLMHEGGMLAGPLNVTPLVFR